MKKKRETLKSLRQKIKWLQRDMKVVENRGYADGYNAARREVATKLRELAAMDPL